MRKLFTIIALTFLITISSFADITSNGYYRVQNYGTSRWASLIDNQGYVDKVSGTADLHAIELIKDTEFILSDPGSIVYVTALGGKEYNVSAQGTNLESLVSNSVSIGQSGSADGQNLYYIYGTYDKTVKYINDGQISATPNLGTASIGDISGKYANNKKWKFFPVDVNTSNYFGAVPTINVKSISYCTLYTSFPYRPYSSGVKAYYIGRVGGGMAEMIEITGTVPSATPVIIQCAGENVSDNKLQLMTNTSGIGGNSLKGVYFNYEHYSTVNHVAYNPDTMRVLGTCSDGSLGFITAKNLDYIPANTAYLTVAAGSPSELRCVTPAEFSAGVNTISTDFNNLTYNGNIITSSSEIRVLNFEGKTLLLSNSGSLDVSSLPKGIYIAVSNGESIKFVR